MVRLASMTPRFLKPILAPLYGRLITTGFYKRFFYSPKSRDQLYEYWKNPNDGSNSPDGYLGSKERSILLVSIFSKHIRDRNVSILEIGCNVGRNLNYLFEAGYRSISGIEINTTAIDLLRHNYPDMAQVALIYNTTVEEKIRDFKNEEFDVIFTMAVLEHIHTDSEWIFVEMHRIAKGFIITIEDEKGHSERVFPRKYKEIFESFGMIEIESFNCKNIHGLGESFFARVFKKN